LSIIRIWRLLSDGVKAGNGWLRNRDPDRVPTVRQLARIARKNPASPAAAMIEPDLGRWLTVSVKLDAVADPWCPNWQPEDWVVTVRYKSKLHHSGVGRAYQGWRPPCWLPGPASASSGSTAHRLDL
jgi:hypothetical protein